MKSTSLPDKTVDEETVDTTYFFYLLRCADDSLYAGICRDITKRVAVHNSGKGAKYTRSRRPVELAYWERLADKSTALKREIEVKKWKRSCKLELIANFFPDDVCPANNMSQ